MLVSTWVTKEISSVSRVSASSSLSSRFRSRSNSARLSTVPFGKSLSPQDAQYFHAQLDNPARQSAWPWNVIAPQLQVAIGLSFQRGCEFGGAKSQALMVAVM